MDNYGIVVYEGNNGSHHTEFPECSKRSDGKHTSMRGLSALAGKEILFNQLVENALQIILVALDKANRVGISLEPRTEVAS